MALNAIVQEMMEEGNTSSITYSNDGSSMNGVGSFVVQSLTINGVRRTLPTLGIFTESRESLKDLEITTLKILSAATGHKYSEQDVLKKISSVMTDSTSHNLEVIGLVAEELEVEHIPKTLLCNIHPLMMFQGQMKGLCLDIHNSLGNKKITDCFLVDVEFKNESFIIKSLKCLSNFINKDYLSRPWNRSSHFASFIAPKENRSLSLKDHRFNRLSECALTILYHLDNIGNYLDKFRSIVNGISILDRTFADMEVLKPIYAALALLGVHILKPYQYLLMDQNTKYFTLLHAFSCLYRELKDVPPSSMMKNAQCFNFASETIFNKALPDKAILDELFGCCQRYPTEVEQILLLSLKKFAQGFALMKGRIFGFGENENDDTGSVLKISALSAAELEEIDQNKVQVHNIGEERSVGLFNYETGIRGKKNIEAASRKMILSKASDLLKKESCSLHRMRSQAKEIKELKVAWNERMAKL